MTGVLSSVGALLLAVAMMQLGQGMFYALTSIRLAADGVSPAMIGFVGAAFFAGFSAGPFLAVRVIRRVGHIRCFSVAAAMLCVGGLFIALSDDPWAWAAARLFMGLGMGGLSTVIESWLNDAADIDTRGQTLAFYMVVTAIFQAGGTLLAGLFNPWSLAPFIVGAMFYTLSLAPVSLTRASNPTPPESNAFRFRRLIAISPLGVAAALCAAMLQGAVFALAPAYVLASGFDDARVAATFQTVAIIGMLLIGWPIGKLSDVFDRRTVLIAAGGVNALVCLALAFEVQGGSIWALYALGAAFGGLSASLYSLGVSHANDWLEPWERVGASAGLLVTFGVGAIFGPQLFGALMAAFTANILFFASAAMLVAFVAFGVYRSIARPSTPNADQAPFVAAPRTTFLVAELDPIYEPDPQYTFDFDGDGLGDFETAPPAPARG